MRPLSEAQGKRCERATTPRCKCRCAGRFHGAKRADDVRELPPDDPHRPAEKKRKKPHGPVERAMAELDDQLAGVDRVRSAWNKVFGGGAS